MYKRYSEILPLLAAVQYVSSATSQPVLSFGSKNTEQQFSFALEQGDEQTSL